MIIRLAFRLVACVLVLGGLLPFPGGLATDLAARADDYGGFVRPLLSERCVKCHNEREAKGDVNLESFGALEPLLTQPALIKRLIDALDAQDMPPETEPPLEPAKRTQLIASLKDALRQSAARESRQRLPIHRLNRFQYNYAVRDLFRLGMDVYPLPEKLIVRRDRHIPAWEARMPDVVHVSPRAWQPPPSLSGVQSFPKDLRAEHGFDNQASQLTLSPLLLDAFLRLSTSIVESPDFTAENVGVWNELFAAPSPDVDSRAEIKRRLAPFLRRAFRRSIDDDVLERYVNYASTRLEQGLPFTECMKKVAAAVLCSPMFLYRFEGAEGDDARFALASRLSFFLWSSGPDDELLDLAERRELSQPQVLRLTLERMLADPRIERFLDSFPTQWLQLENVLAATPAPEKSPYYRVDSQYPAGWQMAIEPLLLFDALFVEDRPLVELIAPSFSYRSDFLRDWYESPLTPPGVDAAAIQAENLRLDARRQQLVDTMNASQSEIDRLVTPARQRLLEARRSASPQDEFVDLRPVSAWEFTDNLQDSVGQLHLKNHGDIRIEEGHVVLDRSYLLSAPLGADLRAKSLEVWCRLSNLDQPGGGVMGIQGPGDFFDTIVIGERRPRHWISGSNGFARTDDFPDSTPETAVDTWLHLVMVYEDDGTTRLYRDGVPYGGPFRKGAAVFPKEQSAVIFGLRHLPAIGNRFLQVRIDKARLYDRALTAREVASSAKGTGYYLDETRLLESLSDAQREQLQAARQRLQQARTELAALPPRQDPEQVRLEARRRFEEELRNKLRSTAFRRVPLTDPRYGGVITNAAVLSMTSGPLRTQPIARGSWIIEVIFNDPPPPPPNDVPPLSESDDEHLTIRERFAAHRENPSCAGCHARIDPLGFAMENFDITGRWRDVYENGKPVDASGTLLRTHAFDGPVAFKQALVKEQERFARAFVSHLLRYALARELTPGDTLAIDAILNTTRPDSHRPRAILREIVTSPSFLP